MVLVLSLFQETIMNKNEIAERLSQSEIFENITKRELSKIARKAYVKTFARDETIVKEGELSDKLFFIANGIVTVKKVLMSGKEQIYAHLLSGNTFGEVGILENQPRSATVSALSDVTVIVFDREDFIKILLKFPDVTIELAKLLGKYLTQSNKRLTRGKKERHVVLVFDPFNTNGAEHMAREIALRLSKDNKRKSIYVEYPEAGDSLRNIAKEKITEKIFKHKSGIDILMKPDQLSPKQTRLALLMDNLLNDYENIVLLVKGRFEERMSLILENTDQIIIIASDDKSDWSEIANFHNLIRSNIKHFNTKIFTVLIKQDEKSKVNKHSLSPTPDFEVIFSKETTDNALFITDLSSYIESFGAAVEAFVDRLQRNNQIAVFIPTTYEVNKPVDTTRYIDETLAFLGKRFGGATSEEVKGIWNSNEIGLVGERLFKVHTYATAGDLQKELNDVIEYVSGMKEDLKQEAMAIEINQRLTLI